MVYRLPDDYFSTYVQKIEAVTAADVQRVARTYFTPENRLVLTVLPSATSSAGAR